MNEEKIKTKKEKASQLVQLRIPTNKYKELQSDYFIANPGTDKAIRIKDTALFNYVLKVYDSKDKSVTTIETDFNSLIKENETLKKEKQTAAEKFEFLKSKFEKFVLTPNPDIPMHQEAMEFIHRRIENSKTTHEHSIMDVVVSLYEFAQSAMPAEIKSTQLFTS